ncbi:MAG: hypothetical protein ICV69_15270 [Thermoleophilaceae bacterium]|nr:hypothetical protein [Thermoleophilaceae bacterium]
MTGYLQQDNSRWGQNQTSVTVGSRTWSGQLLVGQSGFMLMALDRYTLAPLARYPKTYTGSAIFDQNDMADMAADLAQLRGADALRIIQAIGTPKPDTVHWNAVLVEINNSHGSGGLFASLDGSRPSGDGGYYAAVLCNGCDAAESSYPATRSKQAGELAGTMRRDGQAR